MRRSAAFVGIAAALAACRGEPRRAPAPPAGPDAPAAPAAGAPTVAAPAPIPRGDRHARAAARRSPVVKQVDGALARSDDRSVVVGSPDAPPLTLRIAPGTAVTLDGSPARAEALPPGAEVRAAYRTGDGGRPTAIRIEARRPRGASPRAAGAAPAAPGPGPEPDAPPPASWEGSQDLPPLGGG